MTEPKLRLRKLFAAMARFRPMASLYLDVVRSLRWFTSPKVDNIYILFPMHLSSCFLVPTGV